MTSPVVSAILRFHPDTYPYKYEDVFMNKYKFILMPIMLLAFSTSILAGDSSNPPDSPDSSNPSRIEARQLDERAKVLSEYFKKYNSPFQYHAQDFIDAADENGLDWKLVPAISGVESTFGKHSYGYNAWGWGIYGDNRLGFNSWRDGIYTVSGGLKKNYVDKGLTEPYSMNKVYASSKTWGSRVTYFMDDMEQFEEEIKPAAKIVNPLKKTFGASAQIAFKI
ncbi:hypothetical protein A3B39_00300 [Candidatus Daviesbacteria bacterium RIFCSPLOWO2_01_FULL_37_10]|nr:MAG: hypothetical protein A2111_03315 [Candidatus Daviesbacteria bacterium GWA1_38_6]OGE44836.1 MAG: hypothetical protein A3B39_00300 [Candidatus Daviesbacteria bacterium RIFCSPLOWO2_01_FULL_37_10]